MENQSVIEVKNIVSAFGDTVIHDKLSLSVNKGEILAIVGGSGSGKTVLLRQILMLHRPKSGAISVFGENILSKDVDKDPIRRRFGVLFQKGALFSSLTVLENTCLPLQELTKLPQETIKELALIKLGMARYPMDSIHKFPAELSGGMLKRAALARAIIMDPDLLFLDEPTSGLDPESAAGLDELVVDLKNALGLTVVMVTHDVDTLWDSADRVAFLGDKKVLAVKPVAELIKVDNPLIQAYFSTSRTKRQH